MVSPDRSIFSLFTRHAACIDAVESYVTQDIQSESDPPGVWEFQTIIYHYRKRQLS